MDSKQSKKWLIRGINFLFALFSLLANPDYSATEGISFKTRLPLMRISSFSYSPTVSDNKDTLTLIVFIVATGITLLIGLYIHTKDKNYKNEDR